MTRDEIKALHPNLRDSFQQTSDPTDSYNCIAWAAGQDNRRWDPDVYYWPSDVPRDWRLSSVVAAFGTLGYAMCADGQPEAGFEKVAIYCEDENEVLHAARLLNDGWWTSKLGDFDDIKHEAPSDLEHTTQSYGRVLAYLRRRIAPEPPPAVPAAPAPPVAEGSAPT